MTKPVARDARPIALTMGDPAGIGGELLARLYADEPEAMRGTFVVGDLPHLRRAAQAVTAARGGVPLPLATIDRASDALDVPPRCVPVLQTGAASTAGGLCAWGRVDARAGRLAADAVERAARLALTGEVAAVVTAPLHKEALAAAGVPHPGHTELLQALAAAHAGATASEMPVRMMLASDELRAVLVSIHLSLRDAIDAVTRAGVLETLQIAHRSLGALLGRTPRLAVAGLNPHAGEGGLFGREEVESIAPAVADARREGIDAEGPFPPDTVFGRARRVEGAWGYDAVIAMYHDQGLIPVKYAGFDSGVNVTLGLPLVRTSPDHGTAFDIAGMGRANPASLLAAVQMARRLAAGDASEGKGGRRLARI